MTTTITRIITPSSQSSPPLAARDRAAAASSTWVWGQVAVVTCTASMELSAQMASRSGWKGIPSFSAAALPRAGSLSHRQASWAWGFF